MLPFSLLNMFRSITKKYILSHISEEDIFEKYLGIKVVYNKLIRNPLRDDKSPTASFKFVNDRIQFRDWSEPFSRDCFNIVEFIYKCNYYKALEIIASHFNLTNIPIGDLPILSIQEAREKSVSKTELRIKSRPFNKRDIEWWNQFHIPISQLEKFNVVAISHYWINGKESKVYGLAYAYLFGGYDYKLYFPENKMCRFIQNRADILQGYNNLPEYGNHCVITKSYKDVIALDMFGIISVAPMSETVLPTTEQYSDLYNRFDEMFYLGDNDYRGLRATINFKQTFGLQPLVFPKDEPKDFTDNLKVYGVNTMSDIIEDLKNQYGITM